MGKVTDRVGQRFGMLMVKEQGEYYYPPSYPKTARQVQWVCICDCGNEVTVNYNNLRRGATTSCGCNQFAVHTTHGKSGTLTYASWEALNQRCNNPNHSCYDIYGGRGIKICDRWKDFQAFYDDMGERPSSKHSFGS